MCLATAVVAVGCGKTERDFADEAGAAGIAGDEMIGASGHGSAGRASSAGASGSSAGRSNAEAGSTSTAGSGDAGAAGEAGANPSEGGTTSGGSGGAGGAGGTSGASAGSGGAPVVVPPSCVGLAATCGPTGNANCCTAQAVTGGTFNRMSNPATPATVANFKLDDYEISVGRFRKFAAGYPGNKPAAGAGKNPNNAGDPGWDAAWNATLPTDVIASVSCGGLQTWTDAVAGNEARPINCLRWDVAEAFCIWDGGRLPTFAEWNYAATGGAQQRIFPWSSPPDQDVIDATYASYALDPPQLCFGDGINGCAVTDLIPVGSKYKGVGRYGQFDLSGNVSEWAQDWYKDTLPTPCVNCANLVAASFRVMLGGSYEKNAFNQRLSGYSSAIPDYRSQSVGARCARN